MIRRWRGNDPPLRKLNGSLDYSSLVPITPNQTLWSGLGTRETNPQHQHRGPSVAWDHSHSRSKGVCAWSQGQEPGKHHRRLARRSAQARWKEGRQILVVFLFPSGNSLTKYVVWAAHRYFLESTLILVTYSGKKTRKEILGWLLLSTHIVSVWKQPKFQYFFSD